LGALMEPTFPLKLLQSMKETMLIGWMSIHSINVQVTIDILGAKCLGV